MSTRIRRRAASLAGASIALLFLSVVLVWAWGSTGHRIINLNAVIHLPGTMNALKADSLFYRTHASDADNRKVSSDTSFYAESPRHFLDLDDYPDFQHLPRNLDTLIALYGWERVKQNGTNPWTTAWLVDSLTRQLVRGDTMVRRTMSDIGHYVGDAHQPLHCTANYNGQFTGNGGIHSRYETTMVGAFQTLLTVVPDSVHYVSSPLDFAFDYITASNSYTDSIMQADNYAKTVSGWNGSGSVPLAYTNALWERTGGFTQAQFQKATVDLACLWYTAWVNAQAVTGADVLASAFPQMFHLEQNYPNPFNPSTTIRFDLPTPGMVQATIFDLNGRKVATLVNGHLEAGSHEVHWNAAGLTSGVYLVRVSEGAFSQVRKMLLVQ
jgi:hypothetical protein